jgi:Kdo2-lipid IVA lauroyltransferase/acyltransferase
MKALARWFSHAGVYFMRLIAPLPLPVVRGMGWVLGQLLYLLVVPRRRVVITNLTLCFPELTRAECRHLARRVVVRFAQAWLDRSWLWHGSREQLDKRLRITGDVQSLREEPRLVLFAPHFVGMDAGAMALTSRQLRIVCSIYASQKNKVVDDWIYQGRARFGGGRLFTRHSGMREITDVIKAGEIMYLLPDLDFGAQGAEFVPFMGVEAATITSLSRLSRLSKARVMTLFNRMTDSGYDINFSAPWENFPTRDTKEDTRLMNQRLEELVRLAPEQYYWVHRRFKTRPEGQAPVY